MRQFANNASALVTATVTAAATTIQLEAGGGARMPALATGDEFQGTLVAAAGFHEIVTAFQVVGDVVSIDRAQEGTPAQTFPAGSVFEVRLTASVAKGWLQREGDVMAGPLDMANNPLLRANFQGPQRFDVIHTTFIRPPDVPVDLPYTAAENSIVLPANNQVNLQARRPQYMGRVLTNSQMFDGIVFDWFGDVTNVPGHLKLCDGTNGTPDLRGRYIKGWMGSFGVGGSGGQENVRADSGMPFGIAFGLVEDGAGAHAHGADVHPHTLTIAEMPSHHHLITQASGTLGNTGSGLSGTDSPKTTTDTGGDQPHDHGITIDAVGNHTHWIHQPPFFVLAKVMFSV